MDIVIVPVPVSHHSKMPSHDPSPIVDFPIVDSSGTGHLFWIGAKDGELLFKLMTNRVSTQLICGQSAYQDASVFFIESRNLHSVPSQLKGVLCAVKLRKKNSSHFQWRLAVIWKYLSDTDTLQLYVWKGKTVSAPRGMSGCVPNFFVEDPSATTWSVEEEFHRVQVRSLYTTHYFLNQCHGMHPFRKDSFFLGNRHSHGKRRAMKSAPTMTFASLIHEDGCFECSPLGPDAWIFPRQGTNVEWSIPKNLSTEFYTKTHGNLSRSKMSTPGYPLDITPLDEFALTLHTREYPPKVLFEVPPKDKSSKRRSKRTEAEKQYSTWMFEGVAFAFAQQDVEYHTVVVELSDQMKKVDPQTQVDRVAMPIISVVEK